jgi:hypothetical protein
LAGAFGGILAYVSAVLSVVSKLRLLTEG